MDVPLVGAAVAVPSVGAEVDTSGRLVTAGDGDGVVGVEVGARVGRLVNSSVGLLVVGVPYVGTAPVGVDVVGEGVVGAGLAGAAVASQPPQSFRGGVPEQMLSVPAERHVAYGPPRTVHHTPGQPVGDALGRFVRSQLAHDGVLEGPCVGGDGGTGVVGGGGGRGRPIGGPTMSRAAKMLPQVTWIDSTDPYTVHAWPISATSAFPHRSLSA